MKNAMILIGLLLGSAPVFAASATCEASSGKFVTPVVELYTSEGCSSCPPADLWLSRQVRRSDINANFLAFHVDYWDDIGWPDKFARHDYTLRQYARVQKTGKATVYTPQVMIGDQTGVSWSWPDRSDAYIKKANAEPAVADLVLQAQGQGAHWQAKVQITSKYVIPNSQWHLAVYQDGLSSQVRAGENAGKLLNHDRVARQWLGPYALNGNSISKNFTINLSSEADANQTGLLAVLENTANGQVLQSLKLPLSQCRAVTR